MKHNTLLIFLRYPEAGKVKKRLSAEIGPERAAEVYEKLIRRTLGVVCDFKHRSPEVRVILFHTPHDPIEKLKSKFRGPWEFLPQHGEHLGERMANALRAAFETAAGKAVLIGTDLADIEAKDVEGAFKNVGEKAVVLGPASDGGFYLIGTDRPIDAPFHFSTWGTGEVFSRTAKELEGRGFRIRPAAKKNDVDCKCDLDRLKDNFMFASSLSIIIPTLMDPRQLSYFLRYLEDVLWPGDDIVVVRGRDVMEASFHRISPSLAIVGTRKGRGIQQNAGAMLSKGTILFFLHDDTVPPPEFPYLIRSACSDRHAALGCFKLAFWPSNLPLRMISAWANLRTAVFRLPYGDQGLFCRRELFERAGGFGRSYLMEDVDLVRRLRKAGRSEGRGDVSMLPVQVYSSPDRYLRKGVLKASLQNHSIFLLSALGCDERMLYRKYYGSETQLRK